jgi:hypothetical protein
MLLISLLSNICRKSPKHSDDREAKKILKIKGTGKNISVPSLDFILAELISFFSFGRSRNNAFIGRAIMNRDLIGFSFSLFYFERNSSP